MIYLRQKLFESLSRGLKVKYLLLLLGVLGVYLYFWNYTETPKGKPAAQDDQVVVITKLEFDTWTPPTGRETLNAGRFAVVEPNMIQLTQGVEVVDHSPSRSFDKWNSESAIAQFQATNSVQVLSGAQILEAFFPGEVRIERNGATLQSSDVNADYRTEQLSSEKKTEARRRNDSLISENGFKADLKTGDFQFMGPMSGQMEKFP